MLRAFTTTAGTWRLAARPDEVSTRSSRYAAGLEDKRFRASRRRSAGAARAACQLARNGHIVSGGSTLTMQVARLLDPAERSFRAKLRQMVRAIELERRLNKDEILALYLGLAPYGGNLEGVRAASLAYFGKEPQHLTVGEAALLIALPQSPEPRRPDRSVDSARNAPQPRARSRRRGWRGGRWMRSRRAKLEPVPDGRKPMPTLAPHSADAVVAAAPLRRAFTNSPSRRRCRRRCRNSARDRARALGPDVSVAILVVDHGQRRSPGARRLGGLFRCSAAPVRST